MNFTFASQRMVNSAVVDSASGETLFEFSTPHGLQPTTTFRDAQGKVLGTFKFGSDNEVTYQGRSTKMSDWLVTQGTFTGVRTFVAPNGRSYCWKSDSLTDCETGQMVARGKRGHTTLLSTSQPCTLEVMPDGVPVLEAIVLSFVVYAQIGRVGKPPPEQATKGWGWGDNFLLSIATALSGSAHS